MASRMEKAEKAVEEFQKTAQIDIFNDPIVSNIVSEAVSRDTTDREMVKEILERLQEIHDERAERMLGAVPRPVGSESDDAMDYAMRSWYEMTVHSGDKKEKIYVTFTDEEFAEFKSGNNMKKMSMLVGKAEDERAVLFENEDTAADVIGEYVMTDQGITSVEISPDVYERSENGFAKKGQDEGKTAVQVETERVDRMTQSVMEQGTQRYVFNLMFQTGEEYVIVDVDADLTPEEIDTIKTEDPKKAYMVLYKLLEQQRVNSIDEKTGQDALDEIGRLISLDFASVGPVGPVNPPEIQESPEERVQPKEMYAYTEVNIKVGQTTYTLYGDFTEKEKKAMEKSPRMVLLRKADRGELFVPGGISQQRLDSIQQALMSPVTQIKLGKEREVGDPQVAGLWQNRPQITESETERVAAAEIVKKDTTITVAMKARNFIETNIRISEGNAERVRFDHFVFSFQPTEEELREYNSSPATYGIYLSSVFANPSARQAFLERHAGEISVFIPNEGYVDAPKEFWEKYPNGVVINSKRKDDDLRIRLGMFGSTLDAYGHSYPGGVEVRGISSMPNEGTAGEKSRKMRASHNIPETGRAPPQPKGRFTMTVKTGHRYSLNFESNGIQYSLLTDLYDEEYQRVKKIFDENDVEGINAFLEQRVKDNKIILLYEDGKSRRDINEAVNQILVDGVSRLSSIETRSGLKEGANGEAAGGKV